MNLISISPRAIIGILMLVFLSVSTYAQVPIITGFTPAGAGKGASVTITGNSFGSSNLVTIGSVRATIQAQSSSQIRITVPDRAVYGKIRVMNLTNMLEGESAKYFSSRYSSMKSDVATGDLVQVPSLALAIMGNAGDKVRGIAALDLTDDGKPELIALNPDSKVISVFPNTSTPGSFSFGSRLAISSAPDAFDTLVTGDLNGDGRLDILLVGRNSTGTNGSIGMLSNNGNLENFFVISLASLSGKKIIGAAIKDINRDGRPDIIVATITTGAVEEYGISIFPNTTVAGPVSLGTEVSYTLPYQPTSLRVEDMNGDLLPDLVVVNVGSSVNIYKNQGTAGNAINTSTFSTGALSSPNASITSTGASGVYIADLNSDGWPDMVISSSLSLFKTLQRNTTASVGGSFDFSETVSPLWATSYASTSIAIADVTGDGNPDILTTNTNGTSSDINVFGNTSSGTTISFNTKTPFASSAYPNSSVLADFDGDGRMDFAWGDRDDRTIRILENKVQLAPEITSVSQTTASAGTILTIGGTGFNASTGNNVVYIGGVKGIIQSASTTELKVFVQGVGVTGPLTVTNTASRRTGYYRRPILFTKAPAKQAITAADMRYQGELSNSIAFKIGQLDAADFNDDGKPDLVITQEGGTATVSNPTIQVLLSNATAGGNVSFTTGSTNTVSGQNELTPPAIADIDGDGKLDLVAASSVLNPSTDVPLSSSMYVFKQESTPGTFTRSSAFTTGTGAKTVMVADMDGDGRPDVVTLNPNATTYSIFRNTTVAGSISFTSPSAISSNGSTASILIDLNEDGKPDIAELRSGASLMAFRPNASTFGEIAFGTASATSLISGETARYMAAADLNGDNKTDLVVGYESGTQLSVYMNTSTAGGSITMVRYEINLGYAQKGIRLADVNGDGKPDIIASLASTERIAVLRNASTTGTLIFSTSDILYLTQPAGTGPLVVSDFNADGASDILFGVTSPAKLHAYQGGVQMPPTISSIAPVAAVANGTVSVTITGTYFNTTAANNIVHFGAVRATVMAASATSLTVTVPAGASHAPVTVTNASNQLSGVSSQYFLPIFTPNKSTVLSADFTQLPTITTAGYNVNGLVVADLDNDNKPDLVQADKSGNMLLLRKNTGSVGTISYDAPTLLNTGLLGPTRPAVADLDGDGAVDLIVPYYDSESLGIMRNTGSLATLALTATVSLGGGAPPQAVAAGDLDGDGMIDVVAVMQNDPGVSVLRNTSSAGNITFATKLDYSTGTMSNLAVAIGDIDGDGKPDIVVGSANYLSVYRNTSTIGALSFAGPNQYAAQAFTDVYITDVDGDGKLDIVTSIEDNANSGFAVYRNNSTPGSITISRTTITTAYVKQYLSVGDLNGDGKPDVLVGSRNSAAEHIMSVYPNTSVSGTPSFGAGINLPVAAQPLLAINDLDGDGKPDIIGAGNNSAGEITIYRNALITAPITQAAGITVTATGTTASLSWTIGDGTKRAVFMAATSTGSVAPANGTDYTANTAFGSGTQVGSSGWYNVYNGTGNSVTVTGLTPSQVYRVMVTEYNDNGAANAAQYNTNTATNNPINFTALATAQSLSRTTAAERVNTSNVTYNLVFGSPVTGLTTSNFSVSTTGITGASVTSVAGSGSTYTVTVSTGTGNGTLALSLANNTSVTPLTNTLPFVGETYIIDKTAPTLNVVTIASSNISAEKAKPGDIVTVSFTATEAIQTPTVTLAGQTVTATNTSGDNWTASYTMTSTDTEGAIAFSIAFADLAGNAGTAVTATTNSSNVVFDKTAPTLGTINITSSNANTALAKVGDVVTLNFTASEAIQVPTVTLAGQTVTATNTGGDNWTASYTTTSTDAEGAIAFNIAFADIAGNAGTAVTATTNSSNVVFDKTAPTLSTVTISSSNANAASARIGDVVTLNFTSLESLQAPTVTLAGQTAVATNTGGNNWTASYTMKSTDAEGLVTFNISFTDLAGNAGIAVTATTNSSSVMFDKTAPTLSAVSIASSNANALLARTGDVVTLNFTASETIQTPVVSIAGHTVTATNYGGNNWTASYTMTAADATGAVAFTVSFTDLTGNAGTAVSATTDGSSVVFSSAALSFTSVAISSSNANATLAKAGDVITLQFTASANIQTPQVMIAGHVVSATNTGGNNWTATYTLTNNDTEGAVAFSITATDASGNTGTANATTNNSSVMFDKTAPVLTQVTITSSNANSAIAVPGDVVTLNFTASEGISTPAATLAGHVVSVVNTGGNNWRATYTIQSNDPNGTIAFIIAGFADAAGNAGTAVTATTDNSAVAFSSSAPTWINGATQAVSICANAGAQALNNMLAANDGDIGQTLTWTVVAGPAHGTLAGFPATAQTNGGMVIPVGISYTPAAGYAGTDAFTIQVSDGSQSATAVINFTMAQPVDAIRMSTISAPSMAVVALQARNFGATYAWSPAAGLNSTTIANPSAQLAADQEYQVAITTAAGCTTVDTVLVRRYQERVYVPNVFSPNGDGKNDILLPNLVGVKELRYFRVFNRAGKKLFESSNPGIGWDGRYNGAYQAVDTYVWVIEVITNEGVLVTKQGTITLMR